MMNSLARKYRELETLKGYVIVGNEAQIIGVATHPS